MKLLLPSIAPLFDCVEGDAVPLLVTRKLAGSVSDTPIDIPLMSLGRNFFRHDGARRKFLSSSCRNEQSLCECTESVCVCVRESLSPHPFFFLCPWPADCCIHTPVWLWPTKNTQRAHNVSASFQWHPTGGVTISK